MTKKITFVIPTRNNLEFLKLAINSIKYLLTKHDILILDDASTDGTKEWLASLKDISIIIFRNEGPKRIGIVGMFDKGIEMAKTEIICAFHADMVAGPTLDQNLLKHLSPKTVVSATRIEPPLHPEGPEKVLKDFGTEAEDFSLDHFLSWSKDFIASQKDKTSTGIFAPWCMYKKDFQAVEGHDDFFAPQSKEDSDLFNRFALNGYQFIQTWEGVVYHFTSRGSRFNKYTDGKAGQDSSEWQNTNNKNTRNFIRKWGYFVKHDQMMKPIVLPRYNIGFIVKHCTLEKLCYLEPWCDTIYIDNMNLKEKYIIKEQPNTLMNLQNKIKSIGTKYANYTFPGLNKLISL
ncbi:glycosyltransferase family 2 protein [Candidatus Margulisiibacteriota bacterium]